MARIARRADEVEVPERLVAFTAACAYVGGVAA